MAESLTIAEGGKAEKYETLLPQIKCLIAGEPDLVARMANVAAALSATFHHLWTGFYIVRPAAGNAADGASPAGNAADGKPEAFETPAGSDGLQLVLGPFQGPVACMRINRGRGVCGRAWATGETQVVPDVNRFPGHIACSSLSRSEIVVPVKAADGTVCAVLDIDSAATDTFDATDARYLEALCRWL